MFRTAFPTLKGGTFCDFSIARDRPGGSTFDEPNLVANAGLVLVATLAERLGPERLCGATIDLQGRVGGLRPGRKILTLVHPMVAGASHIDRSVNQWEDPRAASKNPAERFGLHTKGDIAEGYDADCAWSTRTQPGRSGPPTRSPARSTPL